jgi:hypothetical protein
MVALLMFGAPDRGEYRQAAGVAKRRLSSAVPLRS